MSRPRIDALRAFVRNIPDFPKPGILFRDLTPLMGNGPAFGDAIALLAQRVSVLQPTAIVAIEARGFIFGAAVAVTLRLPFVPLRKPGKLPGRTRQHRYDLEYGTDGIEIHEDALASGARVVVVDDLLATGGTAAAAIRLARDLGAEVAGACFVIELAFLQGRARLPDVPVDALMVYD